MSAPAPASSSRRERALLGASAVGVVTLVIGVVIGVSVAPSLEDRATSTTWLEGRPTVGEGTVSVEVDGETYGFRDGVPRWRDSGGEWREGGWPECVAPGVLTVRFATVPVEVDDASWSPVVAVDCAMD